MPVFSKDPASTLDYAQDWSDWLATGDTIASSTWDVSTLSAVTDAKTLTSATVWVSGGEAGKVYQLRNTIVTQAGLTAERTLHLVVEDR